MGNITFKIEGIMETVKVLDEISNSLKGKAMDKTLLKEAEIIAEDARDRAPLGPTGNLKRSLHAKMLDEKTRFPHVAIAAVDRKIAPHAWIIEFGSSRAPAHPYLRPAIDAHANKVIGNIKNETKKLVEGAAK